MSEPKEELNSLLKNIQKGLRVFGVKDLNNALAEMLNDKDGKSQEIKMTLQAVCEDFKIPLRDLIESTSRGIIQEARNTAICLLYFNVRLPIRVISNRVFGTKWTLFVSKAIKRHKTLNKNIKPDKEYLERYERIESVIKNKNK